jgi:hypothetical protein
MIKSRKMPFSQPLEPSSSQSRKPVNPASGIDRFLSDLATIDHQTPSRSSGQPSGRLIFALDATLSRQPTWDMATHIQSHMFEATEGRAPLSVQLVYFRGYRECKASPWVNDSRALAKLMRGLTCQGGMTQIGRVLGHCLREQRKSLRDTPSPAPINAIVLVGDACEEKADDLCHLAGQLGLLSVPIFAFHEGTDPVARTAFMELARLSGGAYAPFDHQSADQLRDLLKAVSAYASGGAAALRTLEAKMKRPLGLLQQMKGHRP